MNDGKKKFSAEVSNGYLLIAIKIPTTVCGLCKAEHLNTVDVRIVEQLYLKGPIQGAFSCPNWESWEWIYTDPRPTLVCPTCAAPIARAKAESKAAQEAAHAIV